MNEIIRGVQVIKMYAWEKSFGKMVDRIRKYVFIHIYLSHFFQFFNKIQQFATPLNNRKEMNAIRSIAYLRATIHSFTMISKLSVFLSLVAYIYFGNIITARKVFIVSSYFEVLNMSLVHRWPIALTDM